MQSAALAALLAQTCFAALPKDKLAQTPTADAPVTVPLTAANERCKGVRAPCAGRAGMQSAALGFLLAQTHFADPLVAVPSAVSVVFMALGGSGLAVFWRNKPVPALE